MIGKERKREANKKYYRANKDKILKKQKERHAAKKDEINERRRQLYAANNKGKAVLDGMGSSYGTSECNSIQDKSPEMSDMRDKDGRHVEALYSNPSLTNEQTLQHQDINVKGSGKRKCHIKNTKIRNFNKVCEAFVATVSDGNGTHTEPSSNNPSPSYEQFLQEKNNKSKEPTIRRSRRKDNQISNLNDEHKTHTSAVCNPASPLTINERGKVKINRNKRSNLMQQDKRTKPLKKVQPCKYCGAYKFYKETDRFCCSCGEVTLAESVLPESLVSLITGTDTRSKEFQSMIRTYNNHFAFTSIGMSCDEKYEKRDHGIYTVKVHGQVHHYLDDLIPQDPHKKLSGIQFYFYDPAHQVSNRMSALPRLDPCIIEELVKLMQLNPYSAFLKQASDLDNIDQYHIVIRCEPGLDQRRYNLPTSTDVAGIWIEDENQNAENSKHWDIRVYTKSGKSHNVQYYYACYDPLQYVLMFPRGEPGWHGNIPREDRSRKKKAKNIQIPITTPLTFEELLTNEETDIPNSAFDYSHSDYDNFSSAAPKKGKRTRVSCREYYVYKLQVRPNDRSYILRFGRLLQQYVIDNYIKIETMRLDYIKSNQKKYRKEHYQGLVDSVVSGLPVGGKIGKRVYLPASFIGGPRDMRHKYLDSMSLVQEFGKPDLFLTITCNSTWPEIKELLQPGEEVQNRPDLVARVFKAKLSVLNDKIMSGEIFGKISSVVHVVEFQKRGLPHAHFLIILKPAYKYLTPDAYDRIVCAELPNQDEDPYLYSLVVKHMMHGPCRELNTSNVCMKDGKCKNRYPKDYAENTSHGRGTYPIYRRRNDCRTVKVRGHMSCKYKEQPIFW